MPIPRLSELLPGWSLLDRWHAPGISGDRVWSDGQDLTIWRSGPDLFELDYAEVIRIGVDCPARQVAITALQSELPQATRDHWLFDQVVPRIRSHEGALVVHAAAVAHGGRCLLLIGQSGHGKSTLAAALAGQGFRLLGDDVVTLDAVGDEVRAEAIYPSLRLLPDSVEALFGSAQATAPTAHYTAKRRVEPDEAHRGSLPVSALFLLGEPDPACTGIRLEPLAPAPACMAMVKESFALDPSDTERAARRLAATSRVADLVPAYRLHYPREYDRLGEVGRALLDAAERA